jgi:hypothetical protein
MFCAPRLVFDGTDYVESRFHVLRSRTFFRRYRVCRVMFSCFAQPGIVFAVPRASWPILMFCAPGHVFAGTEGIGSRFHVVRSLTRFRRYRGLRVSFSVVLRASCLDFMFCAPCLVFSITEGLRSRFHVFRARNHFGGTEGVGTRSHVLRALTRFRRYSGRQVPFSCFALPDSFSAVPSVLGHVFIFCVLGLILGGTEDVGSRFHVLRSRTRFLRCGVRRVPFSCFARPDSFSVVQWASGPVFMFCAP